jgi:hypothetical protein
LHTRQQIIRKITEVLAKIFANRLDRAGSESNKVYDSILQKLAPLFKDANDGVGAPLITCQLPGGNSVPDLTKEQCVLIGGNISQ